MAGVNCGLRPRDGCFCRDVGPGVVSCGEAPGCVNWVMCLIIFACILQYQRMNDFNGWILPGPFDVCQSESFRCGHKKDGGILHVIVITNRNMVYIYIVGLEDAEPLSG
jgi:hypothetical protein